MEQVEIWDLEALEAAMSRVTFERSCIDMGWKWECRGISAHGVSAPIFIGWLIRCSFRRPDRDTGAVSTGFGRWWYVESGSTFSAVAKTMFAASKLILEHELLEAFKVDGLRPFDPHRSIAELTAQGRA